MAFSNLMILRPGFHFDSNIVVTLSLFLKLKYIKNIFYHFTILTCKDTKMAFQNFIFSLYLHDAICIPQICLSNGYRESSIMHENFNLNLQGKCRNISIYQLYTYCYFNIHMRDMNFITSKYTESLHSVVS